MKKLAIALVLGGLMSGGAAQAQGTRTNDPCRPIGPAPVVGGAFGQLQRGAGVGPGAGNTGNLFDGSRTGTTRGTIDTTVHQPVRGGCVPVPAPRPTPAPRPVPAPRPNPQPKKK